MRKAVGILHGESAVVRFFARDYPRWQKEWDVSLEEQLQHSTAKNFERLEPHFQITPSGERWSPSCAVLAWARRMIVPSVWPDHIFTGGQSGGDLWQPEPGTGHECHRRACRTSL